MEEYKNKKCLVNGGTGLIGRQVVDLLVKYGAETHVISLDDLQLNPQVEYSLIDLVYHCDRVNWGYFDYVFHLAGIKASPKMTDERPATMSIPALQVNTNVLEACRINGIKNVLFTSSIGAYSNNAILVEDNAYVGEPMDFYPGMVKRMAEFQIKAYQKEYGLNYKIVRLTNIYGPGDNFDPDNAMFIPSLMAKIKKGKVEIWGDGSNTRDFTYSKDIAKGILQMMIVAPAAEVVNLGSGEGHSVKEVVRLMQKFVDFEVEYTGDSSGIPARVLGISKAMSLGYRSETSLYDGLKKTWKWFLANPDEYEGRLNYFADNRNGTK